MKFGIIYFFIASMSLSETSILLMDYTLTPAEHERASEVSAFLRRV
jgi:hypothetical protein